MPLLPEHSSSRRLAPQFAPTFAPRSAAVLAAVLLAILALLPPGRATAVSVTGCSLVLSALDASGLAVERMEGGSKSARIGAEGEVAAGTRTDPLDVAWDGGLAWVVVAEGASSHALRARLATFGIPLPEAEVDADGSVGVAEAIPFRVTGLYHLTAELVIGDVECAAEGWLRVNGNPFGTVPFLVGLLLVVVGLVLVAAAGRGAPAAGLPGGLVLGMGGALLLVVFAVLPLSEATPVAVIGLGLALGVAAAVQAAGGRPGAGLPSAP